MTVAAILAEIEAISSEFRFASEDHARSQVLASNNPDSVQHQASLRLAKGRKNLVFARLSDQCDLLGERDLSDLARNLIRSAMTRADVAAQIASVQALESTFAEASHAA